MKRHVKVPCFDPYLIYDKLGQMKDEVVYVSFKVGKRRKIKRVRFFHLGYQTSCECCGPRLVGHYRMGGKEHTYGY